MHELQHVGSVAAVEDVVVPEGGGKQQVVAGAETDDNGIGAVVLFDEDLVVAAEGRHLEPASRLGDEEQPIVALRADDLGVDLEKYVGEEEAVEIIGVDEG